MPVIPIKRYKPEQIVTVLRQIEAEIAKAKERNPRIDNGSRGPAVQEV